MSICLCMQSADKVLDLIALKRLGVIGRAGGEELASCGAGKSDVDAALLAVPNLELPIHAVVVDDKLRTAGKRVITHLWKDHVPSEALIGIAPGVFAASPEFNAILGMRKSTRMGRALTLMRACGIFAIDTGSEDGFVRRPQITSIKRLQDFSNELNGSHCEAMMSEAIGRTLERARSPLEARLALALTASRWIGGLGLPRPRLNARVELGEEAQAIIGLDAITVDMLWSDRNVVLEANGKLRHEGRFGDDLTRASALEAQGNAVRLVTSQQFNSPRQMLLLGAWLTKHLGISPRYPSREKLSRLLAELRAFRYPHYCL